MNMEFKPDALKDLSDWKTSNNQDGLRPESITFELYSETEGKVVATQKVTAKDNWTYTFTNLPKKLAGEDILYKINEISVDYYKSTISNKDYTK